MTGRRRRPFAAWSGAVTLAAAMLLSGCQAAADRGAVASPDAQTADAAPSPASDGDLPWTSCADGSTWDAAGLPAERRRQFDVRCATLQVPWDHAHPDRGSVDLAVMRLRSARQHDRIGALVLNPGGPGSSGLDWMPLWASWFPDEVLARFDLVTIDPRGTGSSAPIRCADLPDGLDHAALPDLTTDQGFAAATTRIAARARACLGPLGPRAGLFGTDAVARDLDLLRRSLGEERLTYVGWSYGARLGAHYAHLFPDRVRALVLDGPPNPDAAWPDIVKAQVDGFEEAFSSYVAGCPSRPSCLLVARDPRAALDRVVRTARTHPIRSGRPAGDPPATWDLVMRAVLGFLPSPRAWPALDQALGEADRGDSGSLYDMIDSLEGKTPAHPDTDSDDPMGVILCTDTRPAADVGELRPRITRLVRAHRTFGEYGAWWLFACASWTAPRTPLPVPTASTSVPVLVIGGLADPSTPYSGAQAMARAIGTSAVLLTSAVPGHTSFGRSTCIDDHVVRYLVHGQAPAPGTTCS